MPKVDERFSPDHLASADRPKCIYTYWVTGRGAFPFDMLRYDSAWPADTDSALGLDYSPRYGSHSHRDVKLRSHYPPTTERWSSFGWAVGNRPLRRGSCE